MPKIVFIKEKHVNRPGVTELPRWYRGEAAGKANITAKQKPSSPPNAMAELEALTGLHKVKSIVREITAYAKIQKKREEYSLKNEPLVLHMIFKGNPGCGKTTVARILGRLFHQSGLLAKGHLVEAERADLVGEYIGHTAQKTRDQIKKALGGILFIDEAYSLARGGAKDFGKEAIDTLVKAMEDYKQDLIVILAGYRREMELFMLTNPGLMSRFPIQIDFPDYTREELMLIADQMAREREYYLDQEAREKLNKYLESINYNTLNFSNARLIRNIIEAAIRKQALRLADNHEHTRQELMALTKEDLFLAKNDCYFKL
ncbi:MAG TPA: AAA family ATPase [Firmicutes bacterium]|nr:AAA family ATPase [Bacillota bacterium]